MIRDILQNTWEIIQEKGHINVLFVKRVSLQVCISLNTWDFTLGKSHMNVQSVVKNSAEVHALLHARDFLAETNLMDVPFVGKHSDKVTAYSLIWKRTVGKNVIFWYQQKVSFTRTWIPCKLVIPSLFILWKNLFSEINRKCKLPNMIRKGFLNFLRLCFVIQVTISRGLPSKNRFGKLVKHLEQGRPKWQKGVTEGSQSTNPHPYSTEVTCRGPPPLWHPGGRGGCLPPPLPTLLWWKAMSHSKTHYN